MDKQLRCFLSSSYETDTTTVKCFLEDNQVEVYGLYDLAIGSSIQQILKRKLRQADFAIFVLSNDNRNILYEIGVCEGLGKQYLLILDKAENLPFYLENKLSVHANLKDKDFIRMTLSGFIEELKRHKRYPNKKRSIRDIKKETYDQDTKDVLKSLLSQVQQLRQHGHGRELEYVIEEVFKTLRIKYAQNVRGTDLGIDFALWNNKLGRIVGNPIVVEVKYGQLSESTFERAQHQIEVYSEKSEAKVAMLLYLDRNSKRFKIKPSLHPLILSYDAEDFIKSLLENSFEDLILLYRNKIAHGLE